VTARRRVSSGLNFIAAYTWSKTLSNTDSALYTYSGYYFQDFYHQKGEKSVATFDYPQNLKLTWIYDLPLGRGRKFLADGGKLDRLVGGWRVTAIQNYHSGDALQIIDSGLLSGVGNSNFVSGVRADVVPGVAPKVSFHGPVDSINGTQYLSPNAFAAPPSSPSGTYATRWGTAPRYLTSARGPAWQSEDFAAMKDTRITERFKLTFRADFFNLFNRTGMADPVTDVSDMSSFGRIYDVAQGPRNIMLSLRLEF
jgi:hypothetical protein